MISTLTLLSLSLFAPLSSGDRLVVFAEHAYTAPGNHVEDATITIEDGKIVSGKGGTKSSGADTVSYTHLTLPTKA